MQVLHDMCLMAQADGGITNKEQFKLERVAVGLAISESFVDQCLNESKDLD
jgi:hypothetical protein